MSTAVHRGCFKLPGNWCHLPASVQHVGQTWQMCADLLMGLCMHAVSASPCVDVVGVQCRCAGHFCVDCTWLCADTLELHNHEQGNGCPACTVQKSLRVCFVYCDTGVHWCTVHSATGFVAVGVAILYVPGCLYRVTSLYCLAVYGSLVGVGCRCCTL